MCLCWLQGPFSCPYIIKEYECSREAGPGNPGPGNPGPDLCSLQPGSIMLRECQPSSQKGAVGHLLLSAALARSRGSVTPLHQNSCGTALILYLCDVKGKQMDTSVRSGVRPPQPSPDHRCVSTLVPSHVGSAALCWSHAHSH